MGKIKSNEFLNPLVYQTIIFIGIFSLLSYIEDYFQFPFKSIKGPFWEYFLSVFIAGILFFFLMSKATLFINNSKFHESETLIKEQTGYFLTKRSCAPGKLFLTQTRLIFKSQYDKPKYNVNIPRETIKSCGIYKMFGFLTMGLRINTEDREEIFIINFPKRWIKAMDETRVLPT